MDSLTLARKSNSFDLVEKEIQTTIAQAESSLDQFHENRDNADDLQNCHNFINQLRGIFTLIELQGGAILCEEASAILNGVQVGASEDKNLLLASVNQALFILRRYTDYFERRREDHPELLLDIINRLRKLRNADPLPECYFYALTLDSIAPAISKQSTGDGTDCSFNSSAFDPQEFITRARRLRHMYQVGLLNLLRASEQSVACRLLERASAGFAKITQPSSHAVLWDLAKKASELMLKRNMRITPARQRLFMQIERLAGKMAKQGIDSTVDNIPESVARDLLYLIAISGDSEQSTQQLLARFGAAPAAFDEVKIWANLNLLMGPGSDVLSSLANALNEELSQIKDKLDIIERGIDTEDQSQLQISEALEQFSGTLKMLELHKLSGICQKTKTKLEGFLLDQRRPSGNDLLTVADALLLVEQAVARLEHEGLTAETDRFAEQKASLHDSPYLADAMVVVLNEVQSSISLAKRSITAFIESQGDVSQLENVMSGLESVKGALLMIGQSRAAQALHSTNRFVDEKLIGADESLSELTMDTLADALTSLEYYTDSLNRSPEGNIELLDLAEESVSSLGY